MSKSITGVANTGSVFITGSLELNELKVPTIFNKRIEQNKIELYSDDVVYSSKSDYTINYNDGNLGTNPIFNIKKNNVEKMVINDSGLDVKSGELFYNGTALKSFTETLTNKSIDCNNNTLTNVPTSALSGVVLTTTNQNIGGVKTFNDGIVGTLTGNATTATTLANSRTIAGVGFDGGSNIDIPSSGLSDSSEIVLKSASQVLTNKSISGSQINSGTISNDRLSLSSGDLNNSSDIVLKTASQVLTNKSISASQINSGTIDNARLSLSSSDLTNTANIMLKNATQTITGTNNYIGANAKLTLGSVQPTTLPGKINCNGKIYVDGSSTLGLTIARSGLYDHSNGNAGTTKREWNIVCPSDNNKLRFNFLQQTNGGSITNEDVVQISGNGIETGLITTTKIYQPAGNLTLETENDMIFNVDWNSNGTSNKFSFQDDDEEMVKIFRSSSGGTEHTMSKSYLTASGYIRAENSIIRNSSGIINLGAMLATSSNTDSNDAGELRFNRYSPSSTENIRFHSIKVCNSTIASQNLMEFHLHDPTMVSPVNQGQIKVLTLQGNGDALFHNTLSCSGPINIDSGGIFGEDKGFRYAGITTAVTNFFAFTIGSNRIRCRVNNDSEINISGSISDKRLKSNIVDCDDTTDIVNKIQVKKYTFGDTEFSKNNSFGFEKIENEVGLIADELMELIPQAVQNTEEDKIKTIEYDIIIPYLIKNLQQNNKIIKDLNEKVEELEETILGLMDT